MSITYFALHLMKANLDFKSSIGLLQHILLRITKFLDFIHHLLLENKHGVQELALFPSLGKR